MKNKICFLVLYILFIFYMENYAGVFDFLTSQPGARPAGLGFTYVAISDDVYGLCWNPAGVIQVKEKQLGIEYCKGILDITAGFLGFIYPHKNYSVGLLCHYIFYPATEHTKGVFNFASGLNYSRKISNQMYIGTNIKYGKDIISDKTAHTYILDFGSLLAINNNTRLGVSVINFGPDVKYEGGQEYYKLPITYKFGLSHNLFGKILLSTEISNIYLGKEIYKYAGGIEYNSGEIGSDLIRWSFRTGFSSQIGESENYTISGGIGIRKKYLSVDLTVCYSYPVSKFSHIVSLTMNFGQDFKLAKAQRKNILATVASIKNILSPTVEEGYDEKPAELQFAKVSPEILYREVETNKELKLRGDSKIENSPTKLESLLVRSAYVGKKIELEVKILDKDGVEEVKLEYKGSDNKQKEVKMVGPNGKKTGSWICEIGPFETEGDLEVNLRGVDRKGFEFVQKIDTIKITHPTYKLQKPAVRVVKTLLSLPVAIIEDCMWGLERVISLPFRIVLPKEE
ncbi:MAG: PorV/PorQ family protein [Endomicrobia bacterium]|nr:PorV/PorQ family protein [Endomicrobiia bacterium]